MPWISREDDNNQRVNTSEDITEGEYRRALALLHHYMP